MKNKMLKNLIKNNTLVKKIIKKDVTLEVMAKERSSDESLFSKLYSLGVPKGLEKEYLKINDSGLFDQKFYLESNADVKKSGMNALVHYIKYGWKENRKPNLYFDSIFYVKHASNFDERVIPLIHFIDIGAAKSFKTSLEFDTAYYLSENKDVAKASVNPLRHYLKHGIKEGRAARKLQKTSGTTYSLLANNEVNSSGTAIIIPIYNAYEEIKLCISSVIKYTNLSRNTVIIINDCSTDGRIKPLLESLSGLDGVKLINNEINLGYTKTVNKGAELAGRQDVVLLNSDTVVSKFWLRNLNVAANQDSSIGTVTAVSNNAGAFSVPKSGTNELPLGLSINSMSRLVSNIHALKYIDVPTGNGFCFFIKRKLLDDIGGFDYELFPRGYGEENEFCMRAAESGWTNVVDTKTFVFHVRSASFKDEKVKLIKTGFEAVSNKYPQYPNVIKSIGESILFKECRSEIGEALVNWEKKPTDIKPRIMYVISTRTGGTPQTNKDLMLGVSDQYETFVLACNRKKIEVMTVVNNEYKVIQEIELEDEIVFSNHKSLEYNRIVRTILFDYNIELLHIRHIAWHGIDLPEISQKLEIPVIFSLHDFYTICPTVNLLDENGCYQPMGVSSHGLNPLWNDATSVNLNDDLLAWWKGKMGNMLTFCDAYITTCQSAKKILQNNLPILLERDADFSVIPHGRDFDEFHCITLGDEVNEVIRILLPGNISVSKGSNLIKTIKLLDVNNKIEFHVLGQCDPSLKGIVIDHGTYRRHEFSDRVQKIKPHIAGVFSVWPETYCHTLTESWSVGLPVFGVDYGAVGARIKEHGGGWLSEANAEVIYSKLCELAGNLDQIVDKVEQVVSWQNGYGKENTIHNMSLQYLEKYISVMEGEAPLEQFESLKIASIVKGVYPNVPATAYVRIVDQRELLSQQLGGDITLMTAERLFQEGIQSYKQILVQRDAVPKKLVEPLIALCNKNNVEMILELDDNLFNVPEHIDTEGVYKAYSPYLKQLAEASIQINVTNRALMDVCQEFNSNIKINPNKLLKLRWQQNLEAVDLGLSESALNLLYFGSKTHQEDLRFLIESVEMARKKGRDIQLYVAGVSGTIGAYDFVHRLAPPSGRYDIFVNWLISISGNFDLGVAPLVDLEFSKTKSYLKCLEYSAIDLPVVCSDVYPYIDLKGSQLSSNIKWVENTPEAWGGAFLEFIKADIKEELSHSLLEFLI